MLKVFDESLGESNTEREVTEYRAVFQKKAPNGMFIIKSQNFVDGGGGNKSFRGTNTLKFLQKLTLFRLRYHIGWRGAHCASPPPVSPFLLSNYHQAWHASKMAQNLSRAVKVKSKMTSL